MATENNTLSDSGKAADKAKTVAEDMDNRRVFDSPAAAAEYLGQCAERFSDFGQMTLAAPGIDAEGNFDPEIYTDSMDVMVTLLRNKSKIKAVVVAPIPKVSVLLDSDAGKAWIAKILHKEMNHVAVRALREADDVSTVIDQMPTTIDGYLEPGRGDSGIMEAFNELYKQIITALGSKIPAFAKARLIKSEFKKALESKAYAATFYPVLEDFKGQSLFVAALNLGIGAAPRKGLDPAIFQRWLETRDQKPLSAGAESDDEDEFTLDIGAMSESMLADDKPADATEDAAPESDDSTDTPVEPTADADADPTT
jgi:hypothetical protein